MSGYWRCGYYNVDMCMGMSGHDYRRLDTNVDIWSI